MTTKTTTAKATWHDAWPLWLTFIAQAPYAQQVRAWNMLQQRASVAAGMDRSVRVQWPHAFLTLTPEAVLDVLEDLTR
jgi:hypothetical protein